MKTPNKTLTLAALALGLACISAPLSAQLTPVPTQFHDWKGVDSNWFNPANWSTGTVPDGPDAAVRLLADSNIPNKHIYANYAETGDKTIQLYSLQTGARKTYTVEFSGNKDGWLIINPVGKGFTFNGIIGNSMGLSYDITYPQSTGDSSNRMTAYYVLNSYTRLTLDGSVAGLRVQQNGLSSGIFTLKGNAEMDLSEAGKLPFAYASGTYNPVRTEVIQIGGLQTDVATSVYVGDRYVNLNSRMSVGEESVMGGLFEGDNTSYAYCYLYGWKTRMTGIVNYMGDGRSRFIVGSGAEYIVDGRHNGGITANSGGSIGGSGIINGSITVETGGLLNPGERNIATDTPLTVNAGSFLLNGNLGFDMVTPELYDRLIVNISSSGTMTLNGRYIKQDTSTGQDVMNEGTANLVIGMADTFPRKAGTYDLMTVNLARTYNTTTGTMTASGVIVGDFGENIGYPVSMSLESSAKWVSQSDADGEYQRTLRLILTQGRFSLDDARYAGQSMLNGRHLSVANIVDDLYTEGYGNGNVTIRDTYEPLFDQLNRQPSITLYRDLLDELTPTTFQSWFPSAVVRTNSLVQSLEDRMYQDAAFGRKKGSFQMFLDGYRQEASHGKSDEAAYSNYNTIGTVVGGDYALGEKFLVGGFLSYDSTEYDIDNVGGSSDAKSYTIGLKARYNIGKFQANAIAFYGSDDYNTKRSVALTGLGDWAESDTSGTRLGAALSLAYTLNLPWLEIAPVAGVQWLNWKADGFQERNGGEANLYVCDQSETSLQGKLGVRVSRSFKFQKGYGSIRPFFHYALLREFEADARTMYADVFGAHRIGIEAPGINKDGWRMDVGVDWNATRKLRIELRYNSEYRSAANENVGIRGAVNYSF